MRILLLVIIGLLNTLVCLAAPGPRVAFFYGNNPPENELHAFNWVIVNPKANINPKTFNTPVSQLFAYVSLGEVNPDAPYAKLIKSEWIIAKNPNWQTSIMDLSNPQWREFVLKQLIDPLWAAGYHGFFFDTLDSWQLSSKPQAGQKQGLVLLIKAIKKAHPQARLILNRGFEIIEAVHPEVDGIVAESLFASWNPKTKQYEKMNATASKNLLGLLKDLQKRYQLPIIIIDYLPDSARAEARSLAKKIADLDFVPWIGNAELDSLGVGLVEVIPRKILFLYTLGQGELIDLNPLLFPLQYMGYITETRRLSQSLPNDNLAGQYAGIVIWMTKPVSKHHQALAAFLSKQAKANVPIVFMNNFGLPPQSQLLKQLGIKAYPTQQQPKSVAVAYQDPSIGYEILPKQTIIDFSQVNTQNARVLLKIKASNGLSQDSVAITPFGGYALWPYTVVGLPNGESRWVLNPFKFFKEALKQSPAPIPDLTTANGRRMLFAHIDGDAFISNVPWEPNSYCGELILKEILNTYTIPTTVSVIQREFELIQSNPPLEERLRQVARKIFSLPWVMIATHTYAHPLYWNKLVVGQVNAPYLSYPSKDYLFSYEKEILGSTDFINTQLAPKGKKVKLVLWSGNAELIEKPLQLASQAGLGNLNGMAPIFDRVNNSLTNLSALGINVGPYFHLFSPIANDYTYTDNWSQPLYAFIKVIGAFELTESPQRFKPISIYYHFYSAVDQAAFRALKSIYQWAMAQNTTPVFLLDYMNKVMDFNRLVIAQDLADNWLISHNGSLREFRLAGSGQHPDLTASHNVAGYNQANQDQYIHLGSAPESWLHLTSSANTRPYLISANANEADWHQVDAQHYELSLKGYLPLKFELANSDHCQLFWQNKPLTAQANQSYQLDKDHHGLFQLYCPDKRA